MFAGRNAHFKQSYSRRPSENFTMYLPPLSYIHPDELTNEYSGIIQECIVGYVDTIESSVTFFT